MLDGIAAMTRFLNLISSEPDISKVKFETVKCYSSINLREPFLLLGSFVY